MRLALVGDDFVLFDGRQVDVGEIDLDTRFDTIATISRHRMHPVACIRVNRLVVNFIVDIGAHVSGNRLRSLRNDFVFRWHGLRHLIGSVDCKLLRADWARIFHVSSFRQARYANLNIFCAKA